MTAGARRGGQGRGGEPHQVAVRGVGRPGSPGQHRGSGQQYLLPHGGEELRRGSLTLRAGQTRHPGQETGNNTGGQSWGDLVWPGLALHCMSLPSPAVPAPELVLLVS